MLIVRVLFKLVLVTSCYAITNKIHENPVREHQYHYHCLQRITQQSCRKQFEQFKASTQQYPVLGEYVVDYCCKFYAYKLCALEHVAQYCPFAKYYVTEEVQNNYTWRCFRAYDYKRECVQANFILQYVLETWTLEARQATKLILVIFVIVLLILFHSFCRK